jgi:hypothetical protein
MVRVGLTLYLMCATAVGPALCCCLPARFFALFTPAEQSLPACHACCSHHTCDRDGLSGNLPGSRDNPSPGPRDPCPCKESPLERLVLIAPENSAKNANDGRSLETSSFVEVDRLPVAAAFLVPGTPGRASGEPFASALHDARDILRALHILRC